MSVILDPRIREDDGCGVFAHVQEQVAQAMVQAVGVVEGCSLCGNTKKYAHLPFRHPRECGDPDHLALC